MEQIEYYEVPINVVYHVHVPDQPEFWNSNVNEGTNVHMNFQKTCPDDK